LPAGGEKKIHLRLTKKVKKKPFEGTDALFEKRIEEADAFYKIVQSETLRPEEIVVQRQAFASLLWTKQLYYYDVKQWLDGDPAFPPPPKERWEGRNHRWMNMVCFDIISMPDKWEYPWFASWDLAFHCIPFVMIDPDYAKRMLTLMTREWYLHPNGQLPAYEWAYGDANPPVHAWAALRTYKIDAKITGKPDPAFLMEIYNKLLLNFTWWVNRKDSSGRNIFEGGFLGLDNISVFDRNQTMPEGGVLEQADGTSWMGFFCLTMMKIGLELSEFEPVYQDTAFKFFEHFMRIASAMNNCGGREYSLWDEKSRFFYDALRFPDGRIIPIEVHSLVGLLPLLAVETIEQEMLEKYPVFARRMQWFIDNRPHLAKHIASASKPGSEGRHITSIINKEQLTDILKVMLDENLFLSHYGIRSVSKYHKEHPYVLKIDGQEFRVSYQPGESESGLFGGNSNWRGPVWFPINFLLIESLQKYHHYYGDDLMVEFPTGSGNRMNLKDVAHELSRALCHLFLTSASGRRPIFGENTFLQQEPYALFYEYFHGETGAGLGASHQTGWTSLVAKLLQQSSRVRAEKGVEMEFF
ncbi:MAG: glucosidase, partial [Chlamydiia bacterium]|nr:glucosidase [Chlamydiia bacterium]